MIIYMYSKEKKNQYRIGNGYYEKVEYEQSGAIFAYLQSITKPNWNVWSSTIRDPC